MTDVLFINTTDKDRLSAQVNGTMILATKLLNAGFNADILRFYEIDSHNKNDYHRFVEDIVNKILSKKPKCVSFYTLWPYYHILLRIAQRIKTANSEIIIVMAGPHSSLTANATMKAMEFVDYVATGEGENTVVPFFTSILKENLAGIEKIPGLYYRECGEIKFNDLQIELCDLNTLPHWDDRLYTITETGLDSGRYFMPIDAGRGCPFSCTFCCSSLFWKRNYRLKTADRIVEDIKYHNEKYGIKSFWFAHDAFTVNKKLVMEICDRIIEQKLDIRWKCTSRINCLDEELILKMKESGLVSIELGIETGSPRMQKITNKKLDLVNAEKTIKFMLKNKIDVITYFMYGFPEETEDDLNQTLELFFRFIDMGVKHLTLSFCNFNPATEITRKYFDKLVFADKIDIFARGVLGFFEEIEMIKNNKELFSHFYHLSTPVRDNYQYLHYLAFLRNNFPNSFRYIHHFYNGDNIRFYHDIINNNQDIFKKDISYVAREFAQNSLQILKNALKDLELPLRERICALLEYDFDLQSVSKSKVDTQIQKKYAFNYIEYQLKLPIDQYSDSCSELLIESKNGRVSTHIVSI